MHFASFSIPQCINMWYLLIWNKPHYISLNQGIFKRVSFCPVLTLHSSGHINSQGWGELLHLRVLSNDLAQSAHIIITLWFLSPEQQLMLTWRAYLRKMNNNSPPIHDSKMAAKKGFPFKFPCSEQKTALAFQLCLT